MRAARRDTSSMKTVISRSKCAPVRLASLVVCLAAAWSAVAAQGKVAGDPRGAVEAFFNLLKSQQYPALYDYLPSEMQKRATREQVAQGLKRLDGFISIERLEVGRVQQRGDFAVIDTTLYGRLKRPLEMGGQKVEAGKIAVQQYLFKEGGQWKVATADDRTRAHFLKQHPEFSQGFQFARPQFFIKQGRQWKALGGAMKAGQ